MTDNCLAGLQGFPIQVTGWTSLEDKSSIVIPNDILLQFSPDEIPYYYDKTSGVINVNGYNTFFMGGTQYTVATVRISGAKQDGLTNFATNTVMFEYQIWGLPVANSLPKADVAVLSIPIIRKPDASTAGISILKMLTGEATNLINTIPHGKGTDVIKYNTCIETNDTTKKTISLAVAYWTNGASTTQLLIDTWATRMNVQPSFVTKNFVPSGIPDILGFRVLTSFTLSDDEFRTKKNRTYESVHGILQSYSTSVALSVASPEFKNGFRLIKDFDFAKKSRMTTDGYKCIAIDRSRDIRAGKLLVDPATGRRLDEELNQADREYMDPIPQSPEVTVKMLLRICIIIGCIVGGCLLAGVIAMFFSWMLTRKSQNLPPVDKTVEIMEKMLPTNITGVPPPPVVVAAASGAVASATGAATVPNAWAPTTSIGKGVGKIIEYPFTFFSKK
jgi:hypothetical protein